MLKVESPSLIFNPELTINSTNGDVPNSRKTFPERFIEGLSRAIQPVKFEKKLSEARWEYTKSICECVKLYKKTMPSLTDNQAYLFANGYMLTPAEANNVASVFGEAEKQVSQNADPDDLSIEFRDSFIKGAATAYDDEVRTLWTSLLAEETETPGFFSKQTMSSLSNMNAQDAKTFKTLCAYSLTGINIQPYGGAIVPVLKEEKDGSWFYNNGNIEIKSLKTLSSLGLIDTSIWEVFTAAPESETLFKTEKYSLIVKNASESEIRYNFSNALFLDAGLQLGTLCQNGTAKDLQELVEEILNFKGLKCSWNRIIKIT